jgi:tRNA modification GTPase
VFSTDDTIVAAATPPGRAGLGVVRIGGPQAVPIASVLAPGPALTARVATVRRLAAPLDDGDRLARGVAIDQVVLTWFAAPASYTGDDVVEISAHGSPVLLDRIVRSAMAAGARLAAPGRVHAARVPQRQARSRAGGSRRRSDRGGDAGASAPGAFDQLDGTLSHALAAIGEALFDLRVRLEASLDFPTRATTSSSPARSRGVRGRARAVVALLETARRGPAAARRAAASRCPARRTSASRCCSTRSSVASRAIVTPVAARRAIC